MSVNKQDRAEAVAKIANWGRCSGEWMTESDGMVRCSECRSVHPEIMLELPISDLRDVQVRRVVYGRERVEFRFLTTQPDLGFIFDSTHTNALGEDMIVPILDLLKKVTFMEWRYTWLTDSMICFLAKKKTKAEMDDFAFSQRIIRELALRGKWVGSIIYPDAVHCLARSGES